MPVGCASILTSETACRVVSDSDGRPTGVGGWRRASLYSGSGVISTPSGQVIAPASGSTSTGAEWGVAERLEDAAPLATGEVDVAIGTVREREPQSVVADHLDCRDVDKLL